ncbi:MAG: NAD(P)-dependent oxidoreductase [Firmicutes bacterium]|nr:NAD(P)-dependent oxidoreductase [Bacillota bacterium]
MRERLGFIGLGIMGRPMASHLLKAGYSLTVWNRSSGAVDQLVEQGARRATGPAGVARHSDVVFTMVGDSPDVEQVILGPGGVLEGARPGLIIIDMTTISPEVTRRIAAKCAEKGVHMLDAPVSGGEKGAVEATLSIMVGGEQEVFDRCRPLFEILGKTIRYVGSHGMGQTVKLCNQVVCGLNILAAAEGLCLAMKAGVDPSLVLDIITRGAAGSWMLENLGPKMIAGDYAPGFSVKWQMKDLRLALEAAAHLDLPLPGTALVQQLFRAVAAEGGSEEGTQAMIKALKKLGHLDAAD